MDNEQDRGALLSDLRELESKLEIRIREEAEKTRRHFDAEILSESEKTRRHFDAEILSESEKTRRHFNAEILSESEKTRRHFDGAAERVESLVKLVAEVNSHHATVLDDHENRLQKIEKPR